MTSRLKIAIQKDGGRLTVSSKDFLEKIGFGFFDPGNKLSVVSRDGEAKIFFLRASDIAEKVSRGVVDLGIVGMNAVVGEYSKCKVKVIDGEPQIVIDRAARNKVHIFADLKFGNCRLVFAVPKNSKIRKFSDLASQRIATSFPKIVKVFLGNQKIKNYKIVQMAGSVEIAPETGEADAIADLVETGRTLADHGLQEIGGILESRALVIANQKFRKSKKGKIILDELKLRIDSVEKAADKKYAMLNCRENDLAAVERALPAADAPTILPLAKKGAVAVQAVMTEKEFWTALPQLKKAGAHDILLLNVEKIVA